MARASNMTKEEAALVRLRLMAHRAFGAMVENRRGGSEETHKDLDAIEWAIATIQSKIAHPHPDPDTGLVPCGCGGDAVRNGRSFLCAYVTSCSECGTLAWSKASQQEADNNWNTAMGRASE